MVVLSGGAKKDDEEALLDEARGIRDGRGSGSIMGRNVFQRPREQALELLGKVMRIYSGELK